MRLEEENKIKRNLQITMDILEQKLLLEKMKIEYTSNNYHQKRKLI